MVILKLPCSWCAPFAYKYLLKAFYLTGISFLNQDIKGKNIFLEGIYHRMELFQWKIRRGSDNPCPGAPREREGGQLGEL